MNWNRDLKSVDSEENTIDNDITDVQGVSKQSVVQKPEGHQQDGEITELLVCHGASCTCDQSVDSASKQLKVLSHNKYIINDSGEDKIIATTSENKLLNLNFGQCKLPDPGKPVPCTALLKWKDYYEKVELPNGAYVLTDKSTAICTAKGGNIKIVQHGQQANISQQELENASAGSWAAHGPLLTEKLIYTQEAAKNENKSVATLKSISPLAYGEQQPLNTPITFKANFTGEPMDADKQGVSWVVYDANGVPMQLLNDAGEMFTITLKKAGVYLIEACGETNSGKKVSKPYTIKENEIETVTTVDGSTKVRVNVPVEFRLKSLFPLVALPGDIRTISWTVTKIGGVGTPPC